jgi:hypothetical protein
VRPTSGSQTRAQGKDTPRGSPADSPLPPCLYGIIVGREADGSFTLASPPLCQGIRNQFVTQLTDLDLAHWLTTTWAQVPVPGEWLQGGCSQLPPTLKVESIAWHATTQSKHSHLALLCQLTGTGSKQWLSIPMSGKRSARAILGMQQVAQVCHREVWKVGYGHLVLTNPVTSGHQVHPILRHWLKQTTLQTLDPAANWSCRLPSLDQGSALQKLAPSRVIVMLPNLCSCPQLPAMCPVPDPAPSTSARPQTGWALQGFFLETE